MKLMVALVVLAFASAGVSLAQPSTGSYGPLSLVVRDGSVHGVFSEGRLGNGTDEVPQFSCVFLLQGQLQDGVAKITSWFPGEPDRIKGTLKIGDNPTIQLQENHGGCLMSSGDMVRQPYPLHLDQVHEDWQDVGLVTAERVVLRTAPREELTRKRPYLVYLDAIAVLERRNKWLRVTYLDGTERPASGWVREDEVAIAGGQP